MIRKAHVAGRFYPGDRDSLDQQLGELLGPNRDRNDAIGILAPHAGYAYSGKVAGEVYSRINVPDTVIIACPNHTGFPIDISIWPEGEWETPLGKVPVDSDLVQQILSQTNLAIADQSAHLGSPPEHANEVHVPFLQKLNPDVSIVPMVVRARKLDDLKEFGEQVARAIQATGKQTLLVASSDMTHMETHESAKAKDRLAIDRMLELDEDGLWETVKRDGISMCGYGPAIIMMSAAKQMGASRSELIGYATSGQVSGDFDRVVGYAGMTFN